jgi:uncharacterized OsmC-like protein/alpha/beta superfamily hydrolase
MPGKIIRVDFEGSQGAQLSARLDLPAGEIRAYAVFAHCFTCSKDLNATRRISSQLASHGIAVLRFDFTGLGSSEGEFASTDFSSNIEDLKIACNWLAENYDAPQILIGHSLGGAAVLAAAPDIESARAVATIAAPANAEHVTKNFSADLADIRETGKAKVTLGGREFTIRREFLEDLENSAVTARLGEMKKALLVLHSPIDDIVGIDNASEIFLAAKHPKSFISLDSADHLFNRHEDAIFAANMIAAWAERYLPAEEAVDVESADSGNVYVRETMNGKFQNVVQSGPHRLMADEPEEMGGMDSGPTPYDFLSIGLGACTSMTLRMYAERKELDIGAISVEISHDKIHAKDCRDCTDEEHDKGGRIDRFERKLSVSGDIDEETRDKLVEIANKCPVHRTLEAQAKISTRFE